MDNQIDYVVSENMILPEIPIEAEAEHSCRPVGRRMIDIPLSIARKKSFTYIFPCQLFQMDIVIQRNVYGIVIMPGCIKGFVITGPYQDNQHGECEYVLSP